MLNPWVGSRYGHPDTALAGTRLLILGESLYTKEPEKIGASSPTITKWEVEQYALTMKSAFFNRLMEITLKQPRRSLTLKHAESFWQAVAFYNYVPVMVDGRPSVQGGRDRRPEPEMFAAGAKPFREVLKEREPEAVIVCGRELWRWVAPTLDGFEGPPHDVIYYDDGRSVFARIHHPSYRDFKPAKWERRIHMLLEYSARQRTKGWKIMWSPSWG